MEGSKLLSVFLCVILKVHLISGFRAAVFEHAEQSYVTSKMPADIIQANLDYYKRATTVAKSEGADVIVFPEYGIFPPMSRKKLKNFLETVPDPKVTYSNPCEEPKSGEKLILHALSCMARENGIIVVANMGDIQPCEGQKSCPKDGVFQFNTNVAFGRDGTILARYHKEHLFGEAGMDVPTEVQDPTFQTDLGRFATFVCFDIIFKRITEVAHWKGIDAILFPTMWYDNCPLYSAIEYFEAWAIGNNITLLAANGHIPGTATIGSGIMKATDGALAYTFNPDGHSKLIVADVLKRGDKSSPYTSMYIITNNGSKEWTDDGKDVGEICSKKLLKPVKDFHKEYRCLERDTSNFTLTKLVKNKGTIQSCNNGMCCILKYSADAIKENFYFGVNNGSFFAVNRYSWPEENCFLARCEDFENKPCVTFPMRSKTLFHFVSLTANFSTNFIYPSVMSSGKRLVPASQWKFQTSSDIHRASIYFSSDCGEKILTVGLKGRPYDRDPPYIR